MNCKDSVKSLNKAHAGTHGPVAASVTIEPDTPSKKLNTCVLF